MRWLLLVISLALVVLESRRRATDGGRPQALATACERQEHFNSTRVPGGRGRGRGPQRAGKLMMVLELSGTDHQAADGREGSVPFFVIRRITLNLPPTEVRSTSTAEQGVLFKECSGQNSIRTAGGESTSFIKSPKKKQGVKFT
eukprot:1147519-Pelagomonas_calceolata.AAC.2